MIKKWMLIKHPFCVSKDFTLHRHFLRQPITIIPFRILIGDTRSLAFLHGNKTIATWFLICCNLFPLFLSFNLPSQEGKTLVHPFPRFFVPYRLVVRSGRRIVRYGYAAVGTFTRIGIAMFETVDVFGFRLLEV